MKNKIKKISIFKVKKTVIAAGGVIWSGTTTEPKILLIHRPKYDDWSLPKGKQESGENLFTTAVREIQEETGYKVKLTAYLGTVTYPLKNRKKKLIHYWSTEIVSGEFKINSEVDQIAWLPLTQANKKITNKTDKKILERFTRNFNSQSISLYYLGKKIRKKKASKFLQLTAEAFGVKPIMPTYLDIVNHKIPNHTVAIISKKKFAALNLPISEKKLLHNELVVLRKDARGKDRFDLYPSIKP